MSHVAYNLVLGLLLVALIIEGLFVLGRRKA